MKKIMPILITLLGITTATYFTGCNKEEPLEEKPKTEQITKQKPINYTYSYDVDRRFNELNVPLDSVRVYPEKIQNELYSYDYGILKAELLSYTYLKGGTPFVISKLDNPAIRKIYSTFVEEIPYNFVSKLNEDLIHDALELHKTGKSVKYINKLYNEFQNISRQEILEDDIRGCSSCYVLDMIKEHIEVKEFYKYAELNKKYSTIISLEDALDFELHHTPFEDVRKMALKHYKEQKEKENEYIMRKIRE